MFLFNGLFSGYSASGRRNRQQISRAFLRKRSSDQTETKNGLRISATRLAARDIDRRDRTPKVDRFIARRVSITKPIGRLRTEKRSSSTSVSLRDEVVSWPASAKTVHTPALTLLS